MVPRLDQRGRDVFKHFLAALSRRNFKTVCLPSVLAEYQGADQAAPTQLLTVELPRGWFEYPDRFASDIPSKLDTLVEVLIDSGARVFVPIPALRQLGVYSWEGKTTVAAGALRASYSIQHDCFLSRFDVVVIDTVTSTRPLPQIDPASPCTINQIEPPKTWQEYAEAKQAEPPPARDRMFVNGNEITAKDVLTTPVPLRVKATAPFRFRFPFMTDPELHDALDATTDPIDAIVLAAYDFLRWDATYEGGGMTGVQEGLRASKDRLRTAVELARRQR